jgi:hypothetical protein
MNTEDEALRTLRELAAWADASDELSKLHTYGADAKGNSYKLPPPGLSAAARLAWANDHQVPKRAAPTHVSLEEIGISKEEFDKLSGYQKLILVNRAAARRAS